MSEQLASLPAYLAAHLRLSLMALLVGTAVSLPLGVLVTRVKWLEQPVVGVASVIQTIPSLALLAVMVPLLAAIDLSSIGFLPAFIGLTLYSVLPILRNTVTGIAGVDGAVIEAARGVGMTPRQQLFRVELPLAMPVVVAGLRTATVWVVGMATLSTPIGAPSLGNYIFSGLQTRNYGAVLVGCVSAAALALTLDALVRAVEVGLRVRRRALVASAVITIAALYAWAGVSLAGDALAGDRDRVVIGAKTFTEQYILAAVLAQRVERETGARAEVMQSLGSTVAFDALKSGDIDAYVDYSGTIWATVMRRADVPDRARVLEEVEQWLQRTHGIVLVGTLGFENAYALAMREDRARALGIRTIADLTPHAQRMSVGGDYELFERAEWRSIRDTYGLTFATQRSMDPSLMYQAVARGDVDVIGAFSTDGRIAALDLRVLEDPRGAIPPYDALLLASERLAREQPEVIEALRGLAGAIDADAMRRMNLEVDEQGREPAEVARRFLGAR